MLSGSRKDKFIREIRHIYTGFLTGKQHIIREISNKNKKDLNNYIREIRSKDARTYNKLRLVNDPNAPPDIEVIGLSSNIL